jgi:shikimate dehydrogenase
MHNAAFRALGLEHNYEAVRTREDEIAGWVDALRRGEIGGINLTVPHKHAALAFADEIDGVARASDACNVLARKHENIFAYNTDAPALAEELRDGGVPGGTAIVLGNGGAARAAKIALERLGADTIVTRARRDGDEPLLPSGTEEGARWIVQATSAGMTGADPGEPLARAVDFSLAPNALALDVVYDPTETPFLAAARKAGLRTKNGLGMLARQGALAFEIWLGRPAPLDVMLAAIQKPWR